MAVRSGDGEVEHNTILDGIDFGTLVMHTLREGNTQLALIEARWLAECTRIQMHLTQSCPDWEPTKEDCNEASGLPSIRFGGQILAML